jgi:hypothetical protein
MVHTSRYVCDFNYNPNILIPTVYNFYSVKSDPNLKLITSSILNQISHDKSNLCNGHK